MKRFILILLIPLFLAGCTKSNSLSRIGQDSASSLKANQSAEIRPAKTTDQKSTNLPLSFDLPVAFAPQAPLGDWSLPYAEACEEASMIMVAKYFKGEPLDNNIMNQEILKLVKWEDDHGYPLDLTVAQVVEIFG